LRALHLNIFEQPPNMDFFNDRAATSLLISDEKITMMCYGLCQQTVKERNET
jgi:hypothetical protein